jgi:hypothetical protein
MSKQAPDHHDADLILKLYDLRREAVMRQSRATLVHWLPRTYEDVVAITKLSHPDNAAWRQVSSYFEMAYSFARHGIVHADFLAENAGEGLLLFAKLEPHLARLRQELSPTILHNTEWLVQNSAFARQRLELMRKRVSSMLAAQTAKV